MIQIDILFRLTRIIISKRSKSNNRVPVQIDQPELGLPLSMYMDEESYADYISAYKLYMADISKILVSNVS